MADLKKLAEEIVGLTLLEAQELKTILKDEYGIEPAAGGAVMMAGPAGGDAGGAAAEERAACLAILEHETRDPGRGPVSWHFELQDGQLPMLRMADADRHNLLGGHLCVVRRRDTDAHVYSFLATHLAKRVRRVLPERVVWAAPGALGA